MQQKIKCFLAQIFIWLSLGIILGILMGYFFEKNFLTSWFSGFTHVDMSLLIAILFLSLSSLIRFKN